MRNYLRLATIVVLVLALPALMFGQADTSKGSLQIQVRDATGAIIQGANITVTGVGTFKTNTDSRGEAVVFSLTPGVYSVNVGFAGFKTVTLTNVVVRANERTPVLATMQPGAVTETLQVTESGTTVDMSTTTIGTTLTQSTVANLPIQRGIAGLFQLSSSAADSGGPGGSNPSISGASGLENTYIIDGINTTDQGFGSFGVWSSVYGSLGSGVNFDFVKEVQIKSGGFEAQYGQALGGVVNVVTKSGGNAIHGSVYAFTNPTFAEGKYKQPDDFRTLTFYTQTTGRHGWDVGADLGGPLWKNKVFWYGAFNPSYRTTDRTGPKGFATNGTNYPFKSKSFNWVGKINFDLSDKARFEGTAFGDPSRDDKGLLRTLVTNDFDAASSNVYGTRSWAAKFNSTLTPTTLIQASYGWNHTYFIETPANNLYEIRDLATNSFIGGVGFLENNEGDNKQTNIMASKIANVLGSHQIDLGWGLNNVDYSAFRLYSGPDWPLPAATGVDPADVGKPVHGAYFYLYPTRTVDGVTYNNVYRQVRGNYSDPSVATATTYDSAFVQDAWKVNKYITAKLGVRWEEQKLNGNLNSYALSGNWAPRLGFIIDPTGQSKTKLFGNWGRFFEKIPQDLAVRSMSEEAGYNNLNFSALPPSADTLIPGSVGSPIGTSPTIIFGGTRAAYQEEVVGGVEHQFGGGIVVSGKYIHRELKRAIEDVSGITVEQALLGAPQQYVITNPSLQTDIFHNPVTCTEGPNCDTSTGFTLDSSALGGDGIVDGFPDARRVYNAMELQAEKRFSSNWSLLANYRLSKLFGNYEGLFRNDNGQADPNITSLFDFVYSAALGDQFKVGPLNNDRRQTANVYASYLFRSKLNFGIGWHAQTGTPLNKLYAHPAYGNAGEVPVGGRGSQGRSPFENYFDAKVEYQMSISETKKLKFSTDMFNLFDRKTATSIDQNYEIATDVNNPDFLIPASFHRPFYARFSVRFEF